MNTPNSENKDKDKDNAIDKEKAIDKGNVESVSFFSRYSSQLSRNIIKYTIIGSLTTLLLFKKPKIGGVIGMGMAFGYSHPIISEQAKKYINSTTFKISLH